MGASLVLEDFFSKSRIQYIIWRLNSRSLWSSFGLIFMHFLFLAFWAHKSLQSLAQWSVFYQCLSGAPVPVWFGSTVCSLISAFQEHNYLYGLGRWPVSACQFLDLFFSTFFCIFLFFLLFLFFNFFSMPFVWILFYSIYKSCLYIPNTLITLTRSTCFATLLKSLFGMGVLL